ncbi:MAG: deoxyribodipyrimidine photo-lyase [Gammaproteobacteria bacterium]|nr:deoxyribodipyrimidine photo-lyase [Gammaproteobacteria bacterium]
MDDPLPLPGSAAPILVWFRQDLRLDDNPAFAAAAATGRPVVPVYVLDDLAPGQWRLGGASRWWLHHSLAALADALSSHALTLVLRAGEAAAVLPKLVAETRAAGLYWNRCYEPYAVRRDAALKSRLRKAGAEARSFNASLLAEPWEVNTASGGPYRVYTPFQRALRTRVENALPKPSQAPDSVVAPNSPPASETLADWKLLPTTPDWASGFRAAWRPGSKGAESRLREFLDGPLPEYADGRDRCDLAATSGLSAHLHWGEISPRRIWQAVHERMIWDEATGRSADKFLSELIWREFAHHLLFHHPALPEANWRTRFDGFPWRNDPKGLAAWQRGLTGYPMVDAGMRQLWATGWMHNRARMIAASFLVKHLLIHWTQGEAWFWDTLVDADLANNAAGWQWVAGSGADAAPYFRIFNPVLQGRKHDPEGAYVRRFVPELAKLPTRWIHAPWEAPHAVLDDAGVALGRTYPNPIVDHAVARARALAAYRSMP